MLGRRQDLLDHGPKQANHVREHDAPSRRAWFLYSKKKGHAQDDLETFEIGLPPLAPERVASAHSRSYIPRCTLRKGKSEVQDVHLASAFLAPDYGMWSCGGEHAGRLSTPVFKEDDPMLHSSYCDIVLTHVDNLPPTQKTFIVEVSDDTTLMLTPDVIHSAKLVFQAFETTVFPSFTPLMIGSRCIIGPISTGNYFRTFVHKQGSLQCYVCRDYSSEVKNLFTRQ